VLRRRVAELEGQISTVPTKSRKKGGFVAKTPLGMRDYMPNEMVRFSNFDWP